LGEGRFGEGEKKKSAGPSGKAQATGRVGRDPPCRLKPLGKSIGCPARKAGDHKKKAENRLDTSYAREAGPGDN